MKTFLKFTAVFILGLVIGGAATGYFVRDFYKQLLAEVYVLELGQTAMNATFLRRGDTEIILGSLERSIPDLVLGIYQDETLKNARALDTSMMMTRQFYFCTKTPVPDEIADIINNLPPLPDPPCGPPGSDAEKTVPGELETAPTK